MTLFWLGICIGFVLGIIAALALVGLARNGRSHWGREPTEEEIAEFDAELKSKGLPSIAEPMVPKGVPYLRVVA